MKKNKLLILIAFILLVTVIAAGCMMDAHDVKKEDLEEETAEETSDESEGDASSSESLLVGKLSSAIGDAVKASDDLTASAETLVTDQSNAEQSVGQYINSVSNAVGSIGTISEYATQINGQNETLINNSMAVSNTIQELKNYVFQLENSLGDGLGEAEKQQMVAMLQAIESSLDGIGEGTNALTESIQTYTTSVSQLSQTAAQANVDASTLSTQAETLKEAISGITLRAGSLKSDIEQYKKEKIGDISSIIEEYNK